MTEAASRLAVHLSDSASRQAGGIFESVRGLCDGLQRSTNWRAAVVAGEDEFLESDRCHWGDVPLHTAAGPLGRLSAVPGMARMARDLAPQMVHLNGLWGPASIAARFSVQGTTKLVLSPHGMIEPWALARSRFKKCLAWQLWMRGLLARVDCFHALCEAERDSIHQLAPGRPVAVIPNGVLLPDEALTARPREKVVLFLGRIHPKKGLSELLKAWALLSSERAAGWRLVVAGWDDGGHETALKQEAEKLALGESIEFLGPVFAEKKQRILAEASAFVLPSFSEGLPMAVLEAWSYGVPVVMTDECHLPRGFDAGAALRCESEPASIASRVAQLVAMSPAERREMGARGRRLASQSFDWTHIGAELGRIYDWLLGGPIPSSIAMPTTRA